MFEGIPTEGERALDEIIDFKNRLKAAVVPDIERDIQELRTICYALKREIEKLRCRVEYLGKEIEDGKSADS